jgi:hypothetical protein
MRDRRDEYKVLVVRSEGRIPLGRHMLRLEDKIKMRLQKVGWGRGGTQTGLMWRRRGTLMNVLMNPQVPRNVGNFWTS